jgi:cation transport ATPase
MHHHSPLPATSALAGADVAMESAGLTLRKGDLRGVVRGVKFARDTMPNLKQNLFFAFFYDTPSSERRC